MVFSRQGVRVAGLCLLIVPLLGWIFAADSSAGVGQRVHALPVPAAALQQPDDKPAAAQGKRKDKPSLVDRVKAWMRAHFRPWGGLVIGCGAALILGLGMRWASPAPPPDPKAEPRGPRGASDAKARKAAQKQRQLDQKARQKAKAPPKR